MLMASTQMLEVLLLVLQSPKGGFAFLYANLL